MSHPQQQGQSEQAGYAPPMQGGLPAPTPGPALATSGSGYQMKRRNPLAVWLGLPLITFGIYGLVWYYKVHAELARFDQRNQADPTKALLSALFGWLTLGIWTLVVWVKLAGHIAQAQRAAGLQPTCSGGLGFGLGIFGFGPLYYQVELNKVVDRYSGAAEGARIQLAA